MAPATNLFRNKFLIQQQIKIGVKLISKDSGYFGVITYITAQKMKFPIKDFFGK